MRSVYLVVALALWYRPCVWLPAWLSPSRKRMTVPMKSAGGNAAVVLNNIVGLASSGFGVAGRCTVRGDCGRDHACILHCSHEQ